MKQLIYLSLLLISAFNTFSQTANEYLSKGIEKMEQEDYDGAIRDFTKSIQLDASNSDSFYMRGLGHIVLGKKDSGCLDLSKAGELGFAQAYERIKEVCN